MLIYVNDANKGLFTVCNSKRLETTQGPIIRELCNKWDASQEGTLWKWRGKFSVDRAERKVQNEARVKKARRETVYNGLDLCEMCHVYICWNTEKYKLWCDIQRLPWTVIMGQGTGEGTEVGGHFSMYCFFNFYFFNVVLFKNTVKTPLQTATRFFHLLKMNRLCMDENRVKTHQMLIRASSRFWVWGILFSSFFKISQINKYTSRRIM